MLNVLKNGLNKLGGACLGGVKGIFIGMLLP